MFSVVFRFGGGDPGVLKAMVAGGHLGMLVVGWISMVISLVGDEWSVKFSNSFWHHYHYFSRSKVTTTIMNKLCWKMPKTHDHNTYRISVSTPPPPPFSFPFHCCIMVKCKLVLDERGGEGQNAYKMNFSNPCDQGCRFTPAQSMFLSSRQAGYSNR